MIEDANYPEGHVWVYDPERFEYRLVPIDVAEVTTMTVRGRGPLPPFNDDHYGPDSTPLPPSERETMVEETAAATREELTQRCGHECLKQPDHDGPHFYGYRLGPYSYEGLLAENERLREVLERIAGLHDGRDSECVRCEARAVLDAR